MKVAIEVSKERMSGLLCSALEGGSNYWYMIQEEYNPSGAKLTVDIPFSGGWLMIDDEASGEEELKKPVKLDMAKLEEGMHLFSESKEMKHHWNDFLNENDDAITGDVYLQFCIFGKVIFG